MPAPPSPTPPPPTAPAPSAPAPAAPEPTAPQRVAIEAWLDPVIDTVGHDPRSAYVERFWLGVLGPSTVLLFRRMASRFDAEPAGFGLDLPETAAALGLTGKDRRDRSVSPVVKALQRSCTFGVARRSDDETYLVRRRFPPLTRRQLERLPNGLQREHRQWIERDARRPVQAEMRLRARRLALSLVELGEEYDDAERQLHRWKFHPAVAHDAVKWAHAEHLARSHGVPASDLAGVARPEDTSVSPDPVAITSTPPGPLRGGVPVITRLAVPSPSGGDAA